MHVFYPASSANNKEGSGALAGRKGYVCAGPRQQPAEAISVRPELAVEPRPALQIQTREPAGQTGFGVPFFRSFLGTQERTLTLCLHCRIGSLLAGDTGFKVQAQE